MNIYEEVKKALQDMLVPQLRSLQVEIRRISEEIDFYHKSPEQKSNFLYNELVLEIALTA